MPLEPPDPGKIAATLQEKLEQIRLLISLTRSGDPALDRYTQAAVDVAAAVALLEPSAPAK